MAISVSRLRAAGLAKESVLGTPITTPTRYLNIVPPDAFTPMIEPLPSKGIEALANMYPKITQGPGTLNGMKVKLEVEPDNIGEILQALFGSDTQTSSFIITTGVNDTLDVFNVSHGLTEVATIAAGSYATITALISAINSAFGSATGGSCSLVATNVGGKIHLEPTTDYYNLLIASGANHSKSAYPTIGFTGGVDITNISNGSGTTAPSTPSSGSTSSHVFTRQAVSQLPSYSWWFDKALKYPIFAGAMCSKLDLNLQAKGILEADTEWVGTVYDGTDGTSKSTSYSALKPFVWSNAVVQIDGVTKSGYDNFKLSLSNAVKADHALNGSIWPYAIYSEGFTPELSMELFFEDTTQYAKFLAGTEAHVNLTLTSTQGGVTYSLAIDIPKWYYKSANLIIPSNGPLKIPFTGLCRDDIGGTGYDVQVTLVNDVLTQY